jgi:hypothetical protein
MEARALSSIPFSVPYMHDLITLRKQQVKEWAKSGEVKNERQLYTKVAEWYYSKGFTKPSATLWFGATQKDVWALLRFIEEKFGRKYPSYVSPFRRKRRDFIPFKGK